MEEIYARYDGTKGRFIQGIPARNLSRQEWDALEESQRALCLLDSLYKIEGKASKIEKPVKQGDE